ncbi:peptide deformylase [Luedemannella flava]|uniref:Peptide deformylase n=1 Tax=Luedemannella flava TaxID=349316 RepID=A0ABP4YT95_9ACTN
MTAEPALLTRWADAAASLTPAVRPVVSAPAAVLSTAGPAVDPADPAVVQLAVDLVATMRVSPGCVGLAAPQVGVGAQVFAVDVTGHPKARTTHGCFVLCNAHVTSASQWKAGREGCMSVPDFTGDVKRAGRLTVTGQLPGTGETIEIVTDAFEARALQHEIDHCDGLLFLDRVAGAHAIYPRQTYL